MNGSVEIRNDTLTDKYSYNSHSIIGSNLGLEYFLGTDKRSSIGIFGGYSVLISSPNITHMVGVDENRRIAEIKLDPGLSLSIKFSIRF